MISPAEQKIIQIDITNACPHACANCTRFVGHHKKTFFMGMDDFKKAVDSLADFPGMIGIMGGEPTIHPDFDKMLAYLSKSGRASNAPKERLKPISNFTSYRNSKLASLRSRLGLWSSLGEGYYRHYEAIQDVFGYQCINDHTHKGEHIALMLPYSELGISREDFLQYRDDCWIQRLWSASVTPKGAFFCEVAAALDMLMGGPGGWVVEPGWWKRKPEDFGYQLKWCEICSACLPVPKAKATDKRDIVSPAMALKLKELGSDKAVDIFDVKSYSPAKYNVNHSCEPYLPAEGNAARVSDTNKTIKPHKITAFVVCVNYDDYLALTLPFNRKEVDDLIVITDADDKRTMRLCKELGATSFVSPRIHEGGAVLAKGKAFNDALEHFKNDLDWVLITDADIILPEDFKQRVKSLVLNPGCLYYTRRWGPEHPEHINDFMRDVGKLPRKKLYIKWAHREVAKEKKRVGNAIEAFPYGYFQLWHHRASCLNGRSKLYCEGSKTAEWDDSNFGKDYYRKDRQIQIAQGDEFNVIHLPHGLFKGNWNGRVSPRVDSVKQMPHGKTGSRIYVCKQECFHNNRLWKVGEEIKSTSSSLPRHFRMVTK